MRPREGLIEVFGNFTLDYMPFMVSKDLDQWLLALLGSSLLVGRRIGKNLSGGKFGEINRCILVRVDHFQGCCLSWNHYSSIILRIYRAVPIIGIGLINPSESVLLLNQLHLLLLLNLEAVCGYLSHPFAHFHDHPKLFKLIFKCGFLAAATIRRLAFKFLGLLHRGPKDGAADFGLRLGILSVVVLFDPELSLFFGKPRVLLELVLAAFEDEFLPLDDPVEGLPGLSLLLKSIQIGSKKASQVRVVWRGLKSEVPTVLHVSCELQGVTFEEFSKVNTFLEFSNLFILQLECGSLGIFPGQVPFEQLVSEDIAKAL
jgi:hypothetical protein